MVKRKKLLVVDKAQQLHEALDQVVAEWILAHQEWDGRPMLQGHTIMELLEWSASRTKSYDTKVPDKG